LESSPVRFRFENPERDPPGATNSPPPCDPDDPPGAWDTQHAMSRLPSETSQSHDNTVPDPL